jgi:hypothetical protein
MNKQKLSIFSLFFIVFIIGYSLLTIISVSRPVAGGIKQFILEKNSKNYHNIHGLISSIEGFYNTKAPFNYQFSKIYSTFHIFLGKRIIKDVYILQNNNLAKNYTSANISNKVSNTINFSNYLKSINIPFYYIQAPNKLQKGKSLLPYSIPDEINNTCDMFLEQLDAHDVNSIDLRGVIDEKFSKYENAFYNTDHHWTSEASMVALRETIIKLKRDKVLKYQCNDTTLLLENLETVYSPHEWLGSLGRKLGAVQLSKDSFSYFRPASQDTNFMYTSFDKSLNELAHRGGTFERAYIIPDLINNRDIRTSRYGAFLENNYAYERLHNSKGKGNVLIIKDSFGRPFSVYSSLLFKNVITVDFRILNSSSFIEVLDSNAIDLVMVLYSPSALFRSPSEIFLPLIKG